MVLKSNLPYAFLTEEQNDFFAGVPGTKRPPLRLCEELAIALGMVSRKEYELVEGFINALESMWERVKGWGVSNHRPIPLWSFTAQNCVDIFLHSTPIPDVIGYRKCDELIIPATWSADIEYIRDVINKLFLHYDLHRKLNVFSGTRKGDIIHMDDVTMDFDIVGKKKAYIGLRYHRMVLPMRVRFV